MILNNATAEELAAKINEYLAGKTFSYFGSDTNLTKPKLIPNASLIGEIEVITLNAGDKAIRFEGTGIAFNYFQHSKVEARFLDGIQIWYTNILGVRKLDWFKV